MKGNRGRPAVDEDRAHRRRRRAVLLCGGEAPLANVCPRNPCRAEQIKIQRNEIQAGWTNSKSRRNEIQMKSLDFLRRIEPYQRVTRTPTAFFFLRRFRPRRRHCGSVGVGLFAVAFCHSFIFVLGSLRFLQASEGLAPFPSRIAWAPFAPTCRPRGLRRQKGTRRPTDQSRVMRPGTEDPWKKTGRSIRCPARMRPLQKSPIRLEPLASGRAPALHACECLTMPVFEPIPFGLPPEADAAALSGAFRAPFIQQWIIITRVPTLCQ